MFWQTRLKAILGDFLSPIVQVAWTNLYYYFGAIQISFDLKKKNGCRLVMLYGSPINDLVAYRVLWTPQRLITAEFLMSRMKTDL